VQIIIEYTTSILCPIQVQLYNYYAFYAQIARKNRDMGHACLYM